MFIKGFKTRILFNTPAEPTPPAGGGDDPNKNKEPGTPSNPANPEPKPGTPDKYEGKSPEELLEMLRNADNTIAGLSGKASKADELEGILMQLMQSSQGGQEPITPEQLFSEEEALEIFKNPSTAVNRIAEKILETSQLRIQKTLENQSNEARQKAEMKERFYGEIAPDLKGYELLVGAVAGTVQAQYPHIHPSRLLGKVAEVTREEIKRMGIQPSSPTPPELLLGGGNRQLQTPELTGQKKEIADLIGSRQ